MKKVSVLLLVLLTTSCNLAQVRDSVTIKEFLPVGSTLHLTQTLDIPEDRSFIYIAHGKVAPIKNYNTVDIYEPYCEFHLDKETSRARNVLPDNFKITKVVEWEKYYGSLGSLQFASAGLTNNRPRGMIKVAVSAGDGGMRIVMYATILSLHSDKQPDVKKMVCGHWDEAYKVEALTLEEIKSALGNLIMKI